MARIYLDSAATTSCDKLVLKKMEPYFYDAYANPSSVHMDGRYARKAIEEARLSIALAIGARPEEIYFTSGGTEGDNWAIKGTVLGSGFKRVIISAIEHPAILQSCEWLKNLGYEIVKIPVDSDGFILMDKLKEAINTDTALISIMMANNEIGTIQHVREIGALAKNHLIPFHTDAVQAVGYIPINVDRMNIDLMTISAHKFHGPKGIGALFVRRGTKIVPLIHGGGQERGMRSGTENVPAIIGMGEALAKAIDRMRDSQKFYMHVQERIYEGLGTRGYHFKINGPKSFIDRLPNSINISLYDADGLNLVIALDYNGISCSSGSACSASKDKPSHVLQAIGCTDKEMRTSLRLSFSDLDTDEGINKLLDALDGIIKKKK